MKVALLGQFGSGNYGNDGSLSAMVATLRRVVPTAEMICICSGPDDVSLLLGVPAVAIGGSPFVSAPARLLNRVAFRIPHRIRAIWATLQVCRDVDVLIVPGTGILDDFHDNAFGWPFVLMRWCVAARLCGARVAFVSVGAGPIRGALSRRFLMWAAGLAGYRTYRDVESRDFMTSVGFDTSHDRVFPDLALGLRATRGPDVTAVTPTVGVGLMTYLGWIKDGPNAEALFAAYLGKMVEFVVWLRAQGWNIHLLGGDASDERAIAAVLEEVDGDQALRRTGALTVGDCTALQDVMADLSRCDIVVASRFHNVVCAVRMRRPTLSIGYAEKNRALLSAAGLGLFCLEIESLQVDTLKSRFTALHAEQTARVADMDRFLDQTDSQLAAQDARLVRFLDDGRRSEWQPRQDLA